MTSLIAIENISIGTKRGSVRTLVIESLLFLEIVIEEVIEEIKTMLKRESVRRIFIENRKSKSISILCYTTDTFNGFTC